MTADIVEPPTTAIAEYSVTAAALADLRNRYQGVQFQVTVPKEMTAAREARRELVSLRVDLEAKRVALKAPVLERGRLLDSEAKRITAELVALEAPIDAQIKAEEDRKEAERARKRREEEARIAGINRQLDAIRQMPLGALGKTVGGITQDLIAAQDIEIDAFPAEYREQAQQLVDATVERLTAMRDQRRDADREAKRIADETAELARLRKADADRMAEEQRVAEAARAEAQRTADEERAERDRLAEVERKRLDDEARAVRERQEAAARAENERVSEANRVERERLAGIEQRHEEERQAKFLADRDRLIAETTLVQAAEVAVELLVEIGYGEHIATQSLQAALSREGATA